MKQSNSTKLFFYSLWKFVECKMIWPDLLKASDFGLQGIVLTKA